MHNVIELLELRLHNETIKHNEFNMKNKFKTTMYIHNDNNVNMTIVVGKTAIRDRV